MHKKKESFTIEKLKRTSKPVITYEYPPTHQHPGIVKSNVIKVDQTKKKLKYECLKNGQVFEMVSLQIFQCNA